MEIKVEGLFYEQNKNKILREISLQIADGEFVGIIGPNGSGKSTLLKCVYRVIQPQQGAIYFDGRELHDLKLKETARYMAVVAQHNDCNFEFTVEELVLMGRAPHKKLLEADSTADYDIAKQALEAVGLAGKEKRSFFTLSGGEQQRVVLARALAQQTPCLIMDEPTNHLDIKYQLQIMEIVKAARLTTLFAVHDLNTAAMYCDRLIAIKDGRLIGSGSPIELLTPEFIKELYEVKAQVNINEITKKLNIVYIP